MSADLRSEQKQKKEHWLRNVFLFSRILVVIAIVGLLVASVIVIFSGFAEVFRIILVLVDNGIAFEGSGKFLSVNMTEMIDLFLIGIVLIITALGLFQLFIDPGIRLPPWLETHSLDTLKERLLVVILVLLAVIFTGAAATADDGIMLAGLGIGISLVMIAIGYILSIVIRARIELKRIEGSRDPDAQKTSEEV